MLLVAGEALANALRHAAPASIEVALDTGGTRSGWSSPTTAAGFDLAGTLRTSHRLGLTSMRERAEALGGIAGDRHRARRRDPGRRWRCPVPADAPLRLLLVDDHEMVRAGLRTFLGLQPDMEVVGEAGIGRAGARAGAAAAAGDRAARPGAAGDVRAGGGPPAAVRPSRGQGRRADQLRGGGLGAARGTGRGRGLPAQGRRPGASWRTRCGPCTPAAPRSTRPWRRR